MKFGSTMKSIIFILFVTTLGCLNQNILSPEADPEFEAETFQGVGYPKIGDIPLLNRKVFKGSRVTIREHPYIVSIRRKYAHYLTGTLLTRNLVISVAHPLHLVPVTELGVVSGQNYADRGTNIMTVLFVIIHENFDPNTLAADIALLRLYEDIPLKIAIKAIMLVSPLTKLEGFRAFVTGWGRCDLTGRELCLPRSSIYFPDEKLDPMLRTVNFMVSSTKVHCDTYERHQTYIRQGMLCLGQSRREDPMCPCLAVPGAPLVVNSRLAGLQSWGFGCGYKHDLPLVYTDIRYYLSWLLTNIPILRKITRSDLTPFFEATKGYIFIQWLEQARYSKTLNFELTHNDLQPREIDKLLANMKGTIFEIRDFINNGTFRESKQKMYMLLRNSSERIRRIETLKLTTNVAEPFISNNTLNKIGLYLNHGLLGDVHDNNPDSSTAFDDYE
ncbi:trypsin delta-like [Galleria mellonella]|uniref:Trypsin delta-like n=1 Tax=Galleria mellonella TaxID=7137 RepID=A0A6J3C0H4_GALME|nr:trypsin delta-like [Galleria mellonella]